MTHPTPAEKPQIEELKQQNTALQTQLLDLEIQLVEQLEEFSKYVQLCCYFILHLFLLFFQREFERRMSDISSAKMEVVQALYPLFSSHSHPLTLSPSHPLALSPSRPLSLLLPYFLFLVENLLTHCYFCETARHRKWISRQSNVHFDD